MPKMSTRNRMMVISALTKLEALIDTRDAVECSVKKDAKDDVRPYVSGWVIPILERLLDEEPLKLYKDRHILNEAERDTRWYDSGKSRCQCGRRAPWQHARKCAIGGAIARAEEIRKNHYNDYGTAAPAAYLPISGETILLPILFDDYEERAEMAEFMREQRLRIFTT